MLVLVAGAAAGSLAGCGDDGGRAPEVIVDVTVTQGVLQAPLGRLGVTVFGGPGGGPADDLAFGPVDVPRGQFLNGAPYRLLLSPRGGDRSRRFRIEVEAVGQDGELIRALTVRGAYARGSRYLRLVVGLEGCPSGAGGEGGPDAGSGGGDDDVSGLTCAPGDGDGEPICDCEVDPDALDDTPGDLASVAPCGDGCSGECDGRTGRCHCQTDDDCPGIRPTCFLRGADGDDDDDAGVCICDDGSCPMDAPICVNSGDQGDALFGACVACIPSRCTPDRPRCAGGAAVMADANGCACLRPGEADPDCPDQRPICGVDGACRACSGDAEAPDPACPDTRPLCIEGGRDEADNVCECTGAAGDDDPLCPAAMPVCGDDGGCRPCSDGDGEAEGDCDVDPDRPSCLGMRVLDDADVPQICGCTADPGTFDEACPDTRPICGTDGACRACVDDGDDVDDCTDPLRPRCLTPPVGGNACGCDLSGAGCPADSPVCDGDTRVCRPCVAGDCSTAERPACLPAGGDQACGCQADFGTGDPADCLEARPFCVGGVCAECVDNRDCPRSGNTVCRGSRCVPCNASRDCVGGGSRSPACLPQRASGSDEVCGCGESYDGDAVAETECPEGRPFCKADEPGGPACVRCKILDDGAPLPPDHPLNDGVDGGPYCPLDVPVCVGNSQCRTCSEVDPDDCGGESCRAEAREVGEQYRYCE